ncbi:MAG: shikimate kinase [Clostridia bacterium]|nr:shikimate kinase [Clostridia bacterium]
MDNIILVGMPGAGKSTLGVLLAKATGKLFVDTDIIIQQKTKRLLQDIIDNDGTDAFLNLEEEILLSVNEENTVIATGGSAVYSEKAMEHFRKSGKIVYLHVDFAEIEKRVTNITTRGIVLKNGKSLADAFVERKPLYDKYADVVVDCTGNSVEESVCRVKKCIDSL